MGQTYLVQCVSVRPTLHRSRQLDNPLRHSGTASARPVGIFTPLTQPVNDMARGSCSWMSFAGATNLDLS